MATIETTYRVWNDSESVYLKIEPYREAPLSCALISTDKLKENEDWYGKIELILNKGELKALSKVLFDISLKLED